MPQCSPSTPGQCVVPFSFALFSGPASAECSGLVPRLAWPHKEKEPWNRTCGLLAPFLVLQRALSCLSGGNRAQQVAGSGGKSFFAAAAEEEVAVQALGEVLGASSTHPGTRARRCSEEKVCCPCYRVEGGPVGSLPGTSREVFACTWADMSTPPVPLLRPSARQAVVTGLTGPSASREACKDPGSIWTISPSRSFALLPGFVLACFSAHYASSLRSGAEPAPWRNLTTNSFKKNHINVGLLRIPRGDQDRSLLLLRHHGTDNSLSSFMRRIFIAGFRRGGARAALFSTSTSGRAPESTTRFFEEAPESKAATRSGQRPGCCSVVRHRQSRGAAGRVFADASRKRKAGRTTRIEEADFGKDPVGEERNNAGALCQAGDDGRAGEAPRRAPCGVEREDDFLSANSYGGNLRVGGAAQGGYPRVAHGHGHLQISTRRDSSKYRSTR